MNPFDDDMESHSHSGRTGPGLGQRLTVDDIKAQQQQIIAGNIIMVELLLWLPYIQQNKIEDWMPFLMHFGDSKELDLLFKTKWLNIMVSVVTV